MVSSGVDSDMHACLTTPCAPSPRGTHHHHGQVTLVIPHLSGPPGAPAASSAGGGVGGVGGGGGGGGGVGEEGMMSPEVRNRLESLRRQVETSTNEMVVLMDQLKKEEVR